MRSTLLVEIEFEFLLVGDAVTVTDVPMLEGFSDIIIQLVTPITATAAESTATLP